MQQIIEGPNGYFYDIEKDRWCKTMAQQTAVDWLVKEFNLEGYEATVRLAKQMQREQHESTCVEVIERILDKLEKGENTNSQDVFNEYYTKTYGNNQNK